MLHKPADSNKLEPLTFQLHMTFTYTGTVDGPRDLYRPLAPGASFISSCQGLHMTAKLLFLIFHEATIPVRDTHGVYTACGVS